MFDPAGKVIKETYALPPEERYTVIEVSPVPTLSHVKLTFESDTPTALRFLGAEGALGLILKLAVTFSSTFMVT